jgi:hypothetical protein
MSQTIIQISIPVALLMIISILMVFIIIKKEEDSN